MVTEVSLSPCWIASTTSCPEQHLAEDGIFAVEPVGHDMGDEKLATVGVWARVCLCGQGNNGVTFRS